MAQPASPAQPATPANPAASAPAPQAIALPEIANQAQLVADKLGALSSDLSKDTGVSAAQAELPQLRDDVQSRLADLDSLLAGTPSIAALRERDAAWRELEGRVADQTRELTRWAGQADQRLAELQQLGASWKLTREPVRAAGGPAGLTEQVDRTIAAITNMARIIGVQRTQALDLQSQFSQLGGKAHDARVSIAKERTQAAGRLLQRDSPPIWRSALRGAAPAQLTQQGAQTLGAQLQAFQAYAAGHPDDLWLHGAFAALCVAGFWRLRRPVRRWAAQEPELEDALRIVDMPFITGALVALLASGFFYRQAPRLWWSAIGIASVVPAIVLTRRVVERSLYPVLYAVAALYVIDELRPLVAASPLLARTVFLAEMLAGIGFVGWRLAQARSVAPPPAAQRPRRARAVRGVAQLVLALLVAAAALNCLGFARLADLIGTATLTSAYLAIVLHAVAEVAEGLVAWLLRIRPLSLLAMARDHRQLLKLRLRHVLRGLALAAWLLASLGLFGVRRLLFEAVRHALDVSVRFGSVQVALGNVLLFALTLWATWLMSRFIRFTLEVEVYPQMTLARGLAYAISKVVHYLVLLLGFVFALAVLGVDMTRFTILVSAFGLGLGFGMQNIVNNFVSGLIVLFERPVEVGDLVQMDDATGIVERIGIRASVIRSGNGAAVIIPNGKLISDRVTNWTLSRQLRRIEIPVVVDASVDPEHIVGLLMKMVRANGHVVATPAPEVLFVKPGPDKLEFELHAWTQQVENAARLRSELVMQINRILRPPQASDSTCAVDPAPLAAPG